MNEEEFKEKARKHIFNSRLKTFPVVFEMYVRSFNLKIDVEKSTAEIINIVRTSADPKTAYLLFCHYLDSLE